jgi:hypothetical protein
MKKLFIFMYLVYIFLMVSGSVFAIGERTISLGGSATWAGVEYRRGITEVRAIRPHPVLTLFSSSAQSNPGYSAATGVTGNLSSLNTARTLDLLVSFDERTPGLLRDSRSNYRLTVPNDFELADRTLARVGNGAAVFGRSGPIVIQPQSRNALFAPGNRIRDFTIEFWLYPQNMENGEQILSWTASNRLNGNYSIQRINCFTSRNRISWSFVNFFTSVDGTSCINIEFSGNTPVVPKRWSHHLIRFDASTGLLEYLVDGSSEAIVYATASRRESSEVYTPVIGNGGNFMLGENFTGLMDELKIHNVYAGRSSFSRYQPSGGRIETRAVDLGEFSSGVVRVNATGGRASLRSTSAMNEFRENGRFRFSDDSEINFFIRASENPYLLNSSQWIAFTPGADITGVRGRYVQISADFYPSADGETSPYLEQLHIVYLPGEPPLPPRNLTASAQDGSVMLRWRHSPASNIAGYLVYYSSIRGELFGNDALQGASPIDVGLTNSFSMEGLRNGTLYYFRVAAYERTEAGINAGEFSAEVTARPLAGLVP